MLAWTKYSKGETPSSSGLKGDHLVGKYYVEFDKRYKSEISQLMDKGLSKAEAEQRVTQTTENADEENGAVYIFELNSKFDIDRLIYTLLLIFRST